MEKGMNGRICLITGATSGIGYETALDLARLGATVIASARDEKKGLEARDKIRNLSGNQKVELALADFSSLEAVRKMAQDIAARYKQLHVLVNNAGGIFGDRKLKPDGVELTFGVNHLAPFLLTNLLLPLLKASDPSRVVTVSSTVHFQGHIDFDDLMQEKKYSDTKAYAQSKLANALFAFELARKLNGSGVTSNCLHPGVVNTNFASTASFVWRKFYQLFGFSLDTPEKGVQTSIYLASSAEMDNVTGKYFSNCTIEESSKESRDEETAERLWETSAKLVGLAS